MSGPIRHPKGRPDVQCEGCSTTIVVSKTGPTPRWCARCRSVGQNRTRPRFKARKCHRCDTEVHGIQGRPGITVCEKCRTDNRGPRTAYEQRRRLRRYGLTQSEYDTMMAIQGGLCPICKTDQPGPKGWCIDHDHESGKVRAILCFRCNLSLGMMNEDPAAIRALADYLEQSK